LTTSESLIRRALARMGGPQLTEPGERSGLEDDKPVNEDAATVAKEV
jgi:hypothetical protein